MKVIREYLLDKECVTTQTVYMPIDAEVVAVQESHKGLILLAVCDFANSQTELRTFKICATEENIYADVIRYIDNFEGSLGRMHILEIVNT